MACGCCRRTGQRCNAARDDFDQPDGPTRLTLPTGQPWDWEPAPWDVVDGIAYPNTDGGFFDLGAGLFPIPPCCQPIAAPEGYATQARYLETQWWPGEQGAFINVGFGDSSGPFGNEAGAAMSYQGSLLSEPDLQMVVGVFGFGPWSAYNPDGIYPTAGSVVRVVIAPAGLAVYIDGVPFGFTPSADLIGLGVDPTSMPNAYVLAAGPSSFDPVPGLEYVAAGCTVNIDQRPFTSTDPPRQEHGLLLDNLGNHLATNNLGERIAWAL